MPTPFDLLDKYFFAGVPSNAVYDLIKTGWQKANERTWEELYLDAFEAALQDESPRLARYADGDITLRRDDLRKVLYYDLDAAVPSMVLSDLTDEAFASSLAETLAGRQALIIGGHTLTEADYAQLVRRLVQHATALFKAAATQNAFQQAMMGQALHDNALLQQTQSYLQQRFDLVLDVLSILPDIKADTEAIIRTLDSRLPVSHAPTSILPDRSERLSAMVRLSRARCIARWQATGLSHEEAKTLADDRDVGVIRSAYQPTTHRPLVVLVAELGTGKSLIGERLFQSAMERARDNIEAPVPVFLEARACFGRLREAVIESAEGIGDVGRQGAAIVIDGVDEAASSAEGFLRECRTIVNFWPNTTIVITSRPLPEFAPNICKESVVVEPLSEEEATGLIKQLSGSQHFHPLSWPPSVRDAIRRPLFAILLSIYLQNPSDLAPQSPGELLYSLVERALGRANADRDASNHLLQRLAVLSIDRGGGFVPTSELTTREHIQTLLQTRLVTERGGSIGFPLAILTEWFAAHSLASGTPNPTDLASDLSRLYLWQNAITMFISVFGRVQVLEFLIGIAERHPAFASFVLGRTIQTWSRKDEGAVLSVSEWATRIRSAMQAWITGIAELSELIAPVNEHGGLCPLGIRGHDDRVVFSWYRGPKERAEIVELSPEDIRTQPVEWPQVWSVRPSHQSVWAWQLTRDSLRDKLTSLLRKKGLPAAGGPLEAEYFWQVSVALAGHGSLWNQPIPLQDVQQSIRRIGANTIVSLRGGIVLNPSQVAWYGDKVADLLSSGSSYVLPVWPGPDVSNHGARWIWDDYSNEQLLVRTKTVLSAAVEGYCRLVKTWFRAFEAELATAVLLPARFVGTLIPSPQRNAERLMAPTLHWYWLPLDHRKESAVDVQLGTETQETEMSFQNIKRHIRYFRPQAANWLPIWFHHGGLTDILEPNPATMLVYKWLEDDLRRVNWVNH